MDLSFVQELPEPGPGESKQEIACAAVTIVSYPDLKTVYEEYAMYKLTQPYMPGFLAFREAGPLQQLFEKLRQEKPQILPQVLMIDGNGILHHRGLGLASHLGVLLDMPAIGVAKNLLAVDGLQRETVEAECDAKLHAKGDFINLVGQKRGILGVAMRSDSKVPIFVSPGHRISVETSRKLVLNCCQYRIPAPVRASDLGSREYIRKWNLKPNIAAVPVAPEAVANFALTPSETNVLQGTCYPLKVHVAVEDLVAQKAEAKKAESADKPKSKAKSSKKEESSKPKEKKEAKKEAKDAKDAKEDKKEEEDKQHESEGPFERKHRNLHLIRLSRTQKARALLEIQEREQKTNRKLHISFICDCSGSMGAAYKDILIPACTNSYVALKPDSCHMVLFGEKVTEIPNGF